MLLAFMQSGKTGTYMKVAIKMLLEQRVRGVLIISGNAETDLRDQCYKDKDLLIQADLDRSWHSNLYF